MRQPLSFPSLPRVGLAVALSLAPFALHAQAFTEAKAGRVDYTRADHAPQTACEQLKTFKAKDLLKVEPENVAARDATPAFCRLSGQISPEIAFEVSLPAKWNGRFYMIGNGGHAGEALDDPGRVAQRDVALKNGFAFAQTNTGHDARKEPGGTFVLSDKRKKTDYAWRAVHLTATTGKALAKEYYGRNVDKAYWNSCSNGGRQGLIEAQRFPEDFDGLVVNAPWVDQTGFMLGALWNQRALEGVGLTAEKVQLLASRVTEKCDAVDGLKDGLLDDPRRCDFDPKRDVPACTAGADAGNCLTPAQADAIAKVYSGPRDSRGKRIFPGFLPGSESAWMGMVVPGGPQGRSADFGLAENTLRYLVFDPPKPDYDHRTFDFDKDLHLIGDWAKQVNATQTDLSKFRKRGGKLLMTYGWADQILQPEMGIDYYEAAVKKNGAKSGDFLRLFMVPGMTHCAGGAGPDQFDAVSAVIDWVEAGKAPDRLTASKLVNGTVARSRPLCPYPQVARHTGSGSTDDAANFRCVAP